MKKLTTSVLAVVLSSSFAVVSAQTVKDSTKTQDIEEVMVVGYSKVNRNEFVGTASQVNTKSIENKAVTNVSQALAGEVAGVRIINPSGQPGANASVRVRGFGSVNGNRDPLYILDGAPFEGNISVINTDDIESMTVLKDATATAIYGARGANGVIVINTKKGKSNRSNIQIESKIGTNLALLPRYDVVQSPEEYIALAWQGLYNKGRLLNNADPAAYANTNLFGSGINSNYNMWNVAGADLIDPNTRQVRDGVTRKYNPENWRDYAFKPGLRTETNLSMSGGADKTTYYTSFGYLKDEGYSINSNFERYNTRMNLGFQPKSWLKGTFNMGYAFTKSKNNGQTSDSGSIFWFVDNIPSIYPLFMRDAAGNKIYDPNVNGDVYDYGNVAGRARGFGLGTNAIADATYDQDFYRKHELNTNLSFEATVAKNLTFETRIGGQYYNNSRDNLNNPYYGSSASTGGAIYKAKYEMFTWNFLQLLRYKNRFGNHGIEAFAAHESNSYEYRFLSGSKAGLVDPSSPEFNNGVTTTGLNSYIYDYKLESYFGSISYDYANKYLLSASVRRDGTSRFKQDKWDVFSSVGLGWIISREDFMNTNLFPLLKLKASYGIVGDQALVASNATNQNIGYYPGFNVYTTGSMMGAIAATYDRYGYPDLTWEKSKKFQTGIEFSLFKDKIIEGSVDYYNNKTDNLIFDVRLAPSTSMAINKANSGTLVNQGFEFTLTGHILKKSDFFLDLNVNGELTRNKLTEMPFDPATLGPKILDVSEVGYGRAQGHSIYDYYMREWAGVNSQTGAAQWVMHYVDTNGNGQFDAGDQKISSLYEFQKANPNAAISQGVTETYADATQKFVGKSALPDIRGAVNLNFGYKNFAIGAQMLYSIGGYSYDSTYAGLMANSIVGNNNWHKDIHNSWQNPGDITDTPRLSNANGTDTNFSAQSTRFLTKSDYFLLNNVNVSYTFTKDVLQGTGLNSLSLSVSGDNLWIKSKRKGFNPSTSETGQSSTYNYAPLSTLTFGVKANF
ncbi:MAG: SusC/RagA family TonB-linked outer membrane protein [Chryseobacterium sp.]|nr:SusC/RagA family TonB-linked outer membrane protein [Chryseobacterium sp.]